MNRRKFLWTGAILVPAAKSIAQAGLRSPAFVGGLNKPAVASACATTDTSIAHDELLEGFQTATTGYENTWAESGTTANIDSYYDTSSLTSGKPTGACDRAWQLVVPSDGTETWATWTKASSIPVTTTIDVVFYIYLSSLPATSKALFPFCIDGDYDDAIARFHIFNSGGSGLCRVQTGDSSSYVSFTASTWHKVQIHLDATPENSWVALDDGAQEQFTRLVTTYKTLKYIKIGAPYTLAAGDADGVSVVVDLICINTP